MIPFNIPFVTGSESGVLDQVWKNKRFAGGGEFSNKTQALLTDKYGFENVFLTSSCTSAIELCARAISLEVGDEVIMPSYTFASTPNPFIQQGATIVFADCNTDYPNVSIRSIISKISSNTKVIMTMHYGGVNDEVEELADLCKSKGIILIEDAAHAIGSSDERGSLGSFGDFSVFSFHDTKNITCGEGGMLVVNNISYLKNIEELYQYGTNRTEFLKGNVDSYEWVANGMSCKLSEISAAVLYNQLLHVDEVIENRKRIYQEYYSRLKSIDEGMVRIFPMTSERANYHNFILLIQEKELASALIQFMKNNGVECSTHYFPLHESRYAKANQLTEENLENATFFGRHLLRLPMYVGLSLSDVNRITQLIHKFIEDIK